MNSFYTFKPEDAQRFALEHGIRAHQHGDELQLERCPYCNNKEGNFSINLKTGAFNCLRASCGAKGNMITLHRDFGFDIGKDVREYERPRITWRRFKAKEIIPTDPAIAYLESRGIPAEVTREYEVTTKKGDDNVLVFPFKNEKGELEFIKYRKTNFDKERDKNKEWCETNTRPILFGMKQCTGFDRLILTEGQIDSLSVAAAGIPNACSVPNGKNGMTWIPHCWDWLCKFSEIVVFGDHENGGMTLLEDVRTRFDCKVKAVRSEDYRECKDANEILQKFGADAVRHAVENAAPVMLPQVKELADVEYESGTGDERLPTGLGMLDNALDGGLAFGYLDILTGKRGDGKSTLGSMILKAALEAGHNVFIYSGEMRTGDVRIWLDRQIAGPDRITKTEVERAGGQKAKTYSLATTVANRIREWYRGRAYIYDASGLSERGQPLETITETYIKQFGCRFVLIDNLMTAIEISGSSGTKFERQEQTAKTLARLAQKYNVLILLVAHKKKTDPKFTSDENDDVLGSSEITNLAGVVMSYERPRSKEASDAYDRLLKVTKNRLTGNLNMNGIGCWYEDASKRIGTVFDDKNATSGAFQRDRWEEMTDEEAMVLDLPFMEDDDD